VGEAVLPTGFARVLRGIATALPDHYDVHVLGVDQRHPGEPSAIPRGRWLLHSNPGTNDPWGLRELPRLLERLSPDLLCVSVPPGAAAALLQVAAGTTARCLRIAHLAIGSPSEVWGHIPGLAKTDAIVTCTTFGRRVLDEGASHALRAEPVILPAIRIIPHGIDSEHFRPLATQADGRPDLLASRRRARDVLFPGRDLGDGLIVLNANRNHVNKRIDLTVEGFARFAASARDAPWLYLHMGTRAARQEKTLVESWGVGDRLLTSGRSEDHPDWPDERLNLLYNACDIGVNTSSGEGFGLVSVEHGASGAAQIVPRHSACEELWPEGAELLSVCPPVGDRTVDATELGTALDRLDRDRTRLEALSQAAWTNATRPSWRWPAVGAAWDALFQELVSSR
jgi:glycosyltransferase involved in cell wall biosynthesis